MIPNLSPGDLILTRSNTWLSKSIRWFTSRKTGNARVSHAAIALGEMFGEQKIIEALSIVKLNPLSKYEGKEIIIYRPSWGLETKNKISTLLLEKEHKGQYGWFKIGLMAIDSLIPGPYYPFTRTLGISSFKVCSQLYAYAAYKAGVPFERNWRVYSPDSLEDEVKSLGWSVVYDTIN